MIGVKCCGPCTIATWEWLMHAAGPSLVLTSSKLTSRVANHTMLALDDLYSAGRIHKQRMLARTPNTHPIATKVMFVCIKTHRN